MATRDIWGRADGEEAKTTRWLSTILPFLTCRAILSGATGEDWRAHLVTHWVVTLCRRCIQCERRRRCPTHLSLSLCALTLLLRRMQDEEDHAAGVSRLNTDAVTWGWCPLPGAPCR